MQTEPAEPTSVGMTLKDEKRLKSSRQALILNTHADALATIRGAANTEHVYMGPCVTHSTFARHLESAAIDLEIDDWANHGYVRMQIYRMQRDSASFITSTWRCVSICTNRSGSMDCYYRQYGAGASRYCTGVEKVQYSLSADVLDLHCSSSLDRRVYGI